MPLQRGVVIRRVFLRWEGSQ